MRTTVIIRKRGAGYVADVCGPRGQVAGSQRVGIEPYEAAVSAAKLMVQHSQTNPAGGDLMAPPEVMGHVPVHLRSIDAQDH